MYIEEIRIDGFGIFRDFRLSGLRPGVNVILGKNEAGKSTLWRFLRFLFFTKNTRMSKDYKALLDISGGDGGSAILRKGIGDETLVVLSRNRKGVFKAQMNGQILDEATFRKRLFANVDERLYNNVYSFTLDELVSFESLSNSGIQDRLFSVRLGLGNLSLRDINDEIEGELKKIYLPRGKNQVINSLLRELDNNRKELNSIRKRYGEYEDIRNSMVKLERELQQLQLELKRKNSELIEWRSYLKIYNDYVDYLRVEKELSAREEPVEIRDDVREKLLLLRNKVTTIEKDLEQLEKGESKGEGERRGLIELQAEHDGIILNEKLLERGREVQALERNLEHFRNLNQEESRLKEEVVQLEGEIQRELEGISPKWTLDMVAQFTGFDVHGERVKDFKKRFKMLQDRLVKLEAKKEVSLVQGGFNREMLIKVTVLIMLIVSGGFLLQGSFLPGLAFLAGAIILFFYRRKLLKDPVSEIEKEIAQVGSEREDLESEFQDYTRALLSLSDLTPEAVESILDKLRILQDKIRRLDGLRKQLTEKVLPEKERFLQHLETLKQIVKEVAGISDPLSLAEAIIEAYRKEEERRTTKETIAEKVRQRQRDVENKRKELNKLKEEIASVLENSGCVSFEEFEAKYREYKEYQEQLRNKEEFLKRIENVVGVGRLMELKERLGGMSRLEIEQRCSQLEGEIGKSQEEEREKNRSLGKLKQQEQEILSLPGLSELTTLRNNLLIRIKDNYLTYMSGKLARKVIEEVSREYEKERQPEVIRRSGAYFQQVTAGRYTSLIAPLESTSIRVYDQEKGRFKELEELSRGTREQLLICLRLGFIEDFERRMECSLPVMMDEVLVNFDPLRARKTASLLSDFSKKRQLLLFTCHPEILSYFDQKDFNEVDLDNR